jgi:hypothetical protein
MEYLFKKWWNGKTVVVDDGGYVPRVIEQRPWLRRMYDGNPKLFWTAFVALGSPIWDEMVKFVFEQFK